MRYILNFDSQKVKDLNAKGITFKVKVGSKEIERIAKLDMEDLAILRYIYGLSKSKKLVKYEIDKDFFWFKYSGLIEEYAGIIDLSKKALNVRFNKYVLLGLIERTVVRNSDGSFSFLKISGLKELVYIPEVKKEEKAPDSNNKKVESGQVHFSEVEDIQLNEEIQGYKYRLEQFMNCKCSDKLISYLYQFKDTLSWYEYDETVLYDMEINNRKKNTLSYIEKSVKTYLGI